MKKAILTAGIVAIVLAMAGADALARGGRRGRMRAGGPGMGPGAVSMLNLTADQQQQIVKLRAEHQVQVAPLLAELGVKRAELQTLWLAGGLDAGAVRDKSAEIEKLRSQLHEARVEHRLAVAGILTPVQRQQMARVRGYGFRGQGGQGMTMCNRHGGRGMGAGVGIGQRGGRGKGAGAGFGKGGGPARGGAGWGPGGW